MDPLRKELIRENLPQLTESLSISAPFLAIFVSREVLAQADVQKIEACDFYYAYMSFYAKFVKAKLTNHVFLL